VPATKPAPPTTISVPPYSFDDSVPPPKLIQTGTDYKAILESMLVYADWLAAHNADPLLVKRIAAPGSQAERGYTHDVTAIHNAGTRIFEVRSGTDDIQILTSKPNVFSARLIQDIRLRRFVRRDGFITSEEKPGTTRYIFVVVKTGGRWYIFDGGQEGRTKVRP
jgi:hypothetical protein